MRQEAWTIMFLLAGEACDCGGSRPPDDTFDGNVIIGDGSPADSSTDDASGADAMDAQALDGTPFDGSSLDASPMDASDPCAEAPVATLSATAAVSEIATYRGEVVAIEGMLERASLSCTEIACPADMPCCNTCTASITIDSAVVLTGTECFAGPGCRGSECGQVCRPPILSTRQRFVGRLEDGPVHLLLFSVD